MDKKLVDIKYTPKYIYQRVDGIINKWEQLDEDVYIDVKSGFIKQKGLLFNGKTSENIIDLIEVRRLY